MQTLGNKCQIFILLKGLIDVPREIARIEEKFQKLEGQIAKLVASMSIEGYEEKVSAHAVRLILNVCGCDITSVP